LRFRSTRFVPNSPGKSRAISPRLGPGPQGNLVTATDRFSSSSCPRRLRSILGLLSAPAKAAGSSSPPPSSRYNTCPTRWQDVRTLPRGPQPTVGPRSAFCGAELCHSRLQQRRDIRPSSIAAIMRYPSFGLARRPYAQSVAIGGPLAVERFGLHPIARIAPPPSSRRHQSVFGTVEATRSQGQSRASSAIRAKPLSRWAEQVRVPPAHE